MKHQEEYNQLRIARVALMDEMKFSPAGHNRAKVADKIILIDKRLKEIEGEQGQTFINVNYKATPGAIERNLQPFFKALESIFIFIIAVIFASLLLYWFFSTFNVTVKAQNIQTFKKTIKIQHVPKKQVNSYIVTATYYHATQNECDAKPLITADGSEIDTSKVKKGLVRWVSLSRDLLQRWGGVFKYGDTIRVEHENPLLCGLWIIHDCMNRRFKQKIDFLVPVGTPLPGLSHGLIITKHN